MDTLLNFQVLEAIERSMFCVKSTTRLDLKEISGDWGGIPYFVNSKGMFYINEIDEAGFVSNYRPFRNLTGINSQNFTGLHKTAYNGIYTGSPNNRETLRGGKPNPLRPFGKDLFIIQEFEGIKGYSIYIFKNGLSKRNDLLQDFVNGKLDDEKERLLKNKKVFFDYTSRSL